MGIPAAAYTLPAVPAGDLANAVLTGTFAAAATGQSAAFMCHGPFNVVFGGAGGPNGNWNGSIQLERSFDGGTTWYVCGVGGGGAQAIYATNNQDVSFVVGECERGVLYRLNCTVHVSGVVNYRFSTSGAAAMSLAIASSI